MLTNTVNNITSQCQVVFFPWVTNVVTNDLDQDQLSATTAIDVSKYIRELTFSKTLDSPAGSFEMLLPNNRDWKEVIPRGCWGLIYMSQNGGLAIPQGTDSIDLTKLQNQRDKIRGIIFVERVAARGTVGAERGEFDVDFAVTGRDFGVVYQETEIWYNRFYTEGKLQEAAAGVLTVQGQKTVDSLLETLHKLFFSPQDIIPVSNSGSAQRDIPLQWLLPPNLFKTLDLSSSDGRPFFGSIEGLVSFDQSLCSYPVENPMTLINGKAWDRLKAHSIEPFHELFTETNADGQPRLIFRYIPWKTSDGSTLGKLNKKVELMTDLEQVPVSAIDIIDWDLGEDTHSRYNYFFTAPDSALFSTQTAIDRSVFKDNNPTTGFPRIQVNSIRRYGLRLMYRTVSSMIQFGQDKVDSDLIFLHNQLMLEYYNNSVFFESGTITIIGTNRTKVGKILVIDKNSPYNGGKVYYIEGYSDHFSVDDKGAGFWTQTLTLTRGFFPGSISKRGQPYTESGEFTEIK